MILLQGNNLRMGFGERTLFSIPHLEVSTGDRIGLIGPNGAGKTTLLQLLAGVSTPEKGEIRCQVPIAYFRQAAPAANGDYRSGGERAKAALKQALRQGAPLLLADEPTTNLDAAGVRWLCRELEGYVGAVVLVSHDRELLERICSVIWSLEQSSLRVFPGNYSAWEVQRDQERAFAQFEYDQYQEERGRLEAEARHLREQARTMRKAPKRMGNSEARLHKGTRTIPQGAVARRAANLEFRAKALEPKERPQDLPEIKMTLGAAHPVRGKTAARLEHFTAVFEGRTVLRDASLSLPTGSRTVLLGDNGSGKTTLLKGLLEKGQFHSQTLVGYFSQEHDGLDLSKSLLDNLREESSLPQSDLRCILANLGLSAGQMGQLAGSLSGGERAKAAFAKLLASDCNLLILDEPTNHIDLYTAEALERLLQSWKGTLLVVTHDQWLTKKLATRLVFLENQALTVFEGNWKAWEEHQQKKASQSQMEDLIQQMRRAAQAAQSSSPISSGSDFQCSKR